MALLAVSLLAVLLPIAAPRVCDFRLAARGHWTVGEAASPPLWVPADGPCDLFGSAPSHFRGCFANASLFFVGDSVSREGLAYWAMAQAGCGESASVGAPGLTPACVAARAWHVHDCNSTCARKDVRPPLNLPDGITLYDVRARVVADLALPLHWETAPGEDESGLSLLHPPDPLHACILVNVGQWHMHEDGGEAYPAEVRAFLRELVDAPAWRHPSTRASGLLTWRSLTPTEASDETRLVLRKYDDLQAHYHAVDDNVTRTWRAVGFPVADVSATAYHPRGSHTRTLTRDSTHFLPHVSNVIHAYVFAQLCESLTARRAAAAGRREASRVGAGGGGGPSTPLLLLLSALAVASAARCRWQRRDGGGGLCCIEVR
jgi:hypothetical protein